jgi:hypothetical protein
MQAFLDIYSLNGSNNKPQGVAGSEWEEIGPFCEHYDGT